MPRSFIAWTLLIASGCSGSTPAAGADSGIDLAGIADLAGTDFAGACPAAVPDPTGSAPCPAGLQCQFGASYFCECGSAGSQWSCGTSIECFTKPARCTPGTSCTDAFEVGARCDAQGYWITCDAEGCYYDDPAHCPQVSPGGGCDFRLRNCPYPSGCSCMQVLDLLQGYLECVPVDGGTD